MNFFQLKQYFVEELSLVYSKQETEQLFFWILQEVFSITRIDYSLQKKESINNSVKEKIEQLIAELQTNRPIQHILGYAYCLERKYKVSPEVLIPRQETEELIDLILKKHQNKPLQLLDIGTGTACIPISLKLEKPLFNISAIDISKQALLVAEENSKKLNASIQFFRLDILNPSKWDIFSDNSFDIIVSNPPYVCHSEKALMHKNVIDFDPEIALYVDDEKALIFYEKIIDFATVKLRPNGMLYFEINEAFGAEIKALLKDCNFKSIQLIRDLQGKDRFVSAQK